MKNHYRNFYNRGLIQFIIVVIIAIAALAYFHIDLREWAERIMDWWRSQDFGWFREQFQVIIDKSR